MLTDAEKKELDALKAKSDLTDEEKARMAALEAKAKEGDDETFSKAYVEQLRKENAKYRTRAKEADEKLAALDGIDPKKYQELTTAQEKAERDKLEKKGEWEKLRDQMAQAHTAELGKKDKEIADLKATIETLKGGMGATVLGHEVAIQAAAAKAINPTVVEMIAKTKTKVKQDDKGKWIIEVLDDEGNPAIDVKTGKPKTVAQLLLDMKGSTEFAHLFEGGPRGSGSGTENFKGKSIKNPWKSDSINLTLQGQIKRENPDLARRLITEAGKDPKTYNL